MAIQPQYLTVAQLLTNRLFRIPDYQRAYSWGSKQRRELFGDIERTSTYEDGREHFMATAVALRRERIRVGTDEHTLTELVDGQQRLTTLVILLKAIEKALSTDDSAESRAARDLQELLIKSDGDALLLLQTNHDTSHFFSQYLKTGHRPGTEATHTIADRNLVAAMIDCEAFVDRWTRAGRGSPLDLLALIKNRLALVLHETVDESAVYTVFEVLNTRGLAVAWLDRLKSGLMGAAFELETGNKAELIRELQTVWKDVYATVGLRLGLSSEALRFAATLRAPQAPSRTLGEEDAVDSLREGAKDAASILRTAQWLLTTTRALDKLVSDSRLNAVTQIAQARLLATAIEARTDLSDADRKTLLRLWEKVSFRIFGMFRKDARSSVGSYIRLAWRVANESLSPAAIRAGLKQIGYDYPIDGAVDQLRDGDRYWGWQDQLRYFYFRYEEHLARQQNQNFSNEQWSKIWAGSAADSIEHVWPQSKAPQKHVHRLGNLVLLPPKLNSTLQDWEPKEKRDAYIGTGLLVAQDVAAGLNTAWNGSAIDAREETLVEWARQEWRD